MGNRTGEKKWNARTLTTDHRPDTPSEMSRIMKCGGILYSSSGSTSRVVWRRPSLKYGPGLKSNLVDEIPLSAVSRSLGKYVLFFKRIHQQCKSCLSTQENIPLVKSVRNFDHLVENVELFPFIFVVKARKIFAW